METFREQKSSTEIESKVKSYQEKYLPEGMRSQKKVNLVIAAGLDLMYARQANFEGLEKGRTRLDFTLIKYRDTSDVKSFIVEVK